MSFDEDEDLGVINMDSMVFGPSPVTPHNPDQPRVREGEFAEALNGQYQGFPFGNPPGLIDSEQQAEIDATVKALANLLYNVQMTAALPAHNLPTNWSQPVDRSGVIEVPAAASQQWLPITQFMVGPGRWMRIVSYGINVREQNYAYDGSLLWRLVVAGVPVPTLEGFAEQRGTLVQPREIFQLAQQDQLVSLEVRRAVAAADPNTVEGCFTGYIWRLRNDYDGTRASVSAY